MCGIAGIYSFNEAASEQNLRLMAQALAHRGPDAEGIFIDQNVGLVHRRLGIIDLSTAANQPMLLGDKRWALAFNGEVYNYNDLRRENGLQCTTLSDTEVVLRLFSQYQYNVLEQFNGMFAFAAFDTQSRQLWLVRDRMGVKPLFYYSDSNYFAFASEIKALLAVPYIKQRVTINRVAVNEFLHLGYIPQPHTIYNEIKKFPAGAYASINQNNIDLQYYWRPEDKILASPMTNYIQARETLRDLLVDSVRLRLKSDVPFGTFLSGGTDSSLVTAIAQSLLSTPLNTFSIAFENAAFNEAPHARAIASYLGTNHHEITVTERDAMAMVDQMITVYDEPFADSSALPTMLVSKLARQQVTMSLTGDGGDELFGGYGAYQWAERLQKPLIHNFRRPIAMGLSLLSNRHKRAAQVFLYPSKEEMRSHIFSQEQYLFSKREVAKLVLPHWQQDIHLEENVPNMLRKLDTASAQAFFDLRYYLKDDLLVKVDRATMRYSLEGREPLLDFNVVEFALNLSPDLKIHNGIQKYILKEVLYDFIPYNLMQRPKWGFSIPLEKWLRGDLRYLLSEYLHEAVVKKHGIVDPQMVADLKNQFLHHDRTYLYNRLWVLIVLHRFLETM